MPSFTMLHYTYSSMHEMKRAFSEATGALLPSLILFAIKATLQVTPQPKHHCQHLSSLLLSKITYVFLYHSKLVEPTAASYHQQYGWIKNVW